MAEVSEGLTRQIDTTVASVARVYDYVLGGKDNYAVDREAFDQLEAVAPSTRPLMVNNRRFLTRVVRVLAEDYGVRQFLDLGCGLPTHDNVHQIARRAEPSARVVYVDRDPMVLAHRAMFEEDEGTVFVHADVRDTDSVLDHPEVERLIDLTEPVAALLVSVLHCVPDADDPGALLRRVADRLPPGSFLVVNQLVSEDARLREWTSGFLTSVTRGNWGRVRRRPEVQRFLEDLDMEILPPGLVEVSTWRPDSELGPRQLTDEWIQFGGVLRKP